jgi:hypothetical protein
MYGWFAILLRRPGSARRDNAMLAMSLIFMTVCNPLGWKFNSVALVFPYLFLLASIVESKADRRGLVALLIASVVLASVKPWIVGNGPYHAFQTLGGRFWGAIALAAGVVLASRAAEAKVDANEADQRDALLFPSRRHAAGVEIRRRAA